MNTEQTKHNMDPINIIAGTTALAALVALAFMSGHEYGRRNGLTAARICERNLANLRVNALLKSENKRKPRTRRSK